MPFFCDKKKTCEIILSQKIFFLTQTIPSGLNWYFVNITFMWIFIHQPLNQILCNNFLFLN
jgi:hypothetical protein